MHGKNFNNIINELGQHSGEFEGSYGEQDGSRSEGSYGSLDINDLSAVDADSNETP